MCDYSLQYVASRPAKVGDQLITTIFDNSGTRSFTAVGQPNVAVCLLPGTELAFEQNVEFDHHVFSRLLSRLRFGKIEHKLARFRRLNIDRPNVHHDALEFPNGQIMLVTRLSEGQRATVLQLPVTTRHPDKTKAGERKARSTAI